MKHPFFLLGLGLMGLWTGSGCGPSQPDEQALRQRLQGVYCDSAYLYRLELRDSTYFNRRVFQSPLGVGHSYESCRGRYQLALEDERWIIRFAKDPRPQAIENCNGELVLWDPEQGYRFGDGEQVRLPDCFDGVVLTKGRCE